MLEASNHAKPDQHCHLFVPSVNVASACQDVVDLYAWQSLTRGNQQSSGAATLHMVCLDCPNWGYSSDLLTTRAACDWGRYAPNLPHVGADGLAVSFSKTRWALLVPES